MGKLRQAESLAEVGLNYYRGEAGTGPSLGCPVPMAPASVSGPAVPCQRPEMRPHGQLAKHCTRPALTGSSVSRLLGGISPNPRGQTGGVPKMGMESLAPLGTGSFYSLLPILPCAFSTVPGTQQGFKKRLLMNE